MPLDNPSDILGVTKLQPLLRFQDFDVFIHAFYPAASHPSGSEDRSVQMWVRVPCGSSGSPKASWNLVSKARGYVCPGPGLLKGRHLMITDKGEPTWVTGSTRYRIYKA